MRGADFAALRAPAAAMTAQQEDLGDLKLYAHPCAGDGRRPLAKAGGAARREGVEVRQSTGLPSISEK